MPGARVPGAESALRRNATLLLLEEGALLIRDQAAVLCDLAQQSAPREGLDATSLSTLVQMVGAGIGVTLIPEMAVPVETRSADVAIARFPDPQPRRRVGLIWRRASPLAPRLDQIAGALRDCAPLPNPAAPAR